MVKGALKFDHKKDQEGLSQEIIHSVTESECSKQEGTPLCIIFDHADVQVVIQHLNADCSQYEKHNSERVQSTRTDQPTTLPEQGMCRQLKVLSLHLQV